MLCHKASLACLCCALLLLLTCAAADTVPALDGSGVLLQTLPMDDYTVGGPEIDPEAMCEDGYSDPSIQVEMYHEWVGNAHFNVAHVKIAHASQLRTALYNDTIWQNNYMWVIAAQKNAIVAVGGEYLYYLHNRDGYTVRMSQTLRDKGYEKRDMLITDQNGDFHITKGFTRETVTALQAEGVQIVNLFNFGPALIIDGEPVYDSFTKKGCYPVGDPQNSEPRTVIAQMGPLEYMFVVVDGRKMRIKNADGTTKLARGATLATVGEYLLAHGCTQAYALDGGGSAAMYYRKTGVYSNPSSKRGVTDIVYFAALEAAE